MNRAKSICTYPGCRTICDGGRCSKHPRKEWTGTSKNRSGDPFYSSHRWKELRALKLMNSPLCECDACKASNAVTPADRVDHIKPRCDYPELELDYDNLRSMSESHHNRHTARTQASNRRSVQ